MPVADKIKARRDIWGSGQGIGQIADASPVAELVERMKLEFAGASGDYMRRISA
jgi:nitronate monooxygenase